MVVIKTNKHVYDVQVPSSRIFIGKKVSTYSKISGGSVWVPSGYPSGGLEAGASQTANIIILMTKLKKIVKLFHLFLQTTGGHYKESQTYDTAFVQQFRDWTVSSFLEKWLTEYRPH